MAASSTTSSAIHVVGDIFCDIVARVPSSDVPARWGDDVLAESIAILPGGTLEARWQHLLPETISIKLTETQNCFQVHELFSVLLKKV